MNHVPGNNKVRPIDSKTLVVEMASLQQQQLFRVCSVILCLRGSHLFCESRWSRLLRAIFRVLFFCVFTYTAFGILRDVFNFSVGTLNSLSYAPFCFISAVFVMYQTRALETMITGMSSHIPLPQMKKLVCQVRAIVSFYAFQLSLVLAIHVYYDLFHTLRPISVIDVVKSIAGTVRYAEFDWLVTSCIFYWTLMRILRQYMDSRLEEVESQAQRPQVDQSLIKSTIKSTKETFREFEDRLSFLPFMWFLYGVVGSAGIVYGALLNPKHMTKVIYVVIDYLPPVLVAIAADGLHQRISDKSDEIIHLLSSNDSLDVGSKILLTLEVESMKKMRLTGLSYFTMDKRLITSFSGSVLTFAALIAGFKRT